MLNIQSYCINLLFNYFYIEDKNTYIEINASWTHGKHPFNENDLDDITLFNKWMNKSDYYKNAAYNWRYRDVNKRNIAINNKFIQ